MKEQAIKINRTNDRFFKSIFGDKRRKAITISLINAVFSFEGTKLISDIIYEDKELVPEYEDGKMSILDIRGFAEDGTKIFIEMQALPDKTFPMRPIYYWSKLYPHTLEKGQEYTELTRTVGINFLNYNYFDYSDFHSMYALYNSKNHHPLTDHFEIHFIEIPKWPTKSIKEMNRLDRWLAYFSNKIPETELEEIAMSDSAIMGALQAESEFVKTPSLMSAYEHREEEIRRYRTAISVSRKEGEEAGMERGIEAGMERGRKQGFEEATKKLAINLLMNGIPVDIISKSTYLSVEQIAELKKELS